MAGNYQDVPGAAICGARVQINREEVWGAVVKQVLSGERGGPT